MTTPDQRPGPEHGTMNAAEVVMFLGLQALWIQPRRAVAWLRRRWAAR